MAVIRIQRTNEFVNRLRNYQLILDGKPIGKIANGEEREFLVPAGTHTLQAKIDWCASPQVEIVMEADSEKVFQVGGFKGAATLIPIMAGLAGLQMALAFVYPTKWLSVLLLFLLLVLFYFFTFGRNRYLRLTETERDGNRHADYKILAP